MRGSNKLLSVEFQPDRSGLVQATDPRYQLLVAEGRDAVTAAAGGFGGCFNPRPSLPRGATSGRPHRSTGTGRFNPRPSLPRGATPGRRHSPTRRTRFNPRPSLPRGATRDVGCPDLSREVSILAPRCRGARRASSAALRAASAAFQSSPLVAEGRDRSRNTRSSGATSFNPRPSLPRGATWSTKVSYRTYNVSILAPRCRGARQDHESDHTCSETVSILAPRCRGARRLARSRIPPAL